MSLRKDFVLRALAKQVPFAALCRQYGISRKTGYKWLRRFEATGIGGLADESRRPLISPLETSSEIQLEIIKLRHKHPTWGARKLARVLHRAHPEKAPSQSTIERVLERAKLLRKRRYRPLPKFSATQAPRVIVEEPNDLWTVDFKGWWRTADGARCDTRSFSTHAYCAGDFSDAEWTRPVDIEELLRVMARLLHWRWVGSNSLSNEAAAAEQPADGHEPGADAELRYDEAGCQASERDAARLDEAAARQLWPGLIAIR